MIGQGRAQEISTILDAKGIEYASQYFGISHDTIHRYMRTLRGAENAKRIPMILSLDIETSPLKAWVWGTGKRYINHQSVIEDWHIITFAAKWLHESSFMSMQQTPDEARSGDDSRLATHLWELLDKADIVIAQNGKQFDIKRMNTRFILNGIERRPSSYQVIDTYEIAKKQFAFTSASQDYMTKILVLPGKLETNFNLWVRCKAGEQEAIDEMGTYNVHDVMGLEELYLKFRPWMTGHPNLSLYNSDRGLSRCGVCNGVGTLSKDSEYATSVSLFDEYVCTSCGGRTRSRKSNLTLEERQVLLVPLAR